MQAEEVPNEANRALAASRNAEIRKSKQELLTQGVESLRKKLKKGKGLTKVWLHLADNTCEHWHSLASCRIECGCLTFTILKSS